MKKIIVVSLFLIISGFTPQLKSLFVQETFAAAAFGDVRCGQFSPGYKPMAPYPGSPYFETELSPDENLCQVLGGTQTEFMDTTITPDPSIIYDKVSKGQSVTWTCSSVETIRSNNPENWGNQEYYSASCGYTPPKVNGSCGTASKTYPSAAVGYGADTLCAQGTASPVNPAFPTSGNTVNWSCTGSNGGTTASCSASKAVSQYTVTATAGVGGSVSPTTQTVPSGGSVILTATPNAGYTINRWTPDKDCYGAGNTCQIDNITSNHSVQVSFEKLPDEDTCDCKSLNKDAYWEELTTSQITWSYDPTGWQGGPGCYGSYKVYDDPTYMTHVRVACSGTGMPPPSDPQINGSCGGSNGGTFSSKPTSNLCTEGTASSVNGSGPWTWNCSGSNGGSNASCSANKTPTPVNGSCGASNHGTFTTAPTTGLCDVGTATPLGGSGPWTWSCSGSNGGNPTSCSANHGEVIITKNHSIPCTPLTYVAEWNAEWSDCEVTSNWFPDGSIKCTQHMIYTPKVILQDYMTKTTTTTYKNGTVVHFNTETTGSCHPDAPKPYIPPKVNTLKLNLSQPSTIY